MERRHFLAGSTGMPGLLAVAAGCSSPPQTPAEDTAKRREINAAADATLPPLYAQPPGSRELVQKARGVLVFPSIVSAGVGIGGGRRVALRRADYRLLQNGDRLAGRDAWRPDKIRRLPLHDRFRLSAVPFRQRGGRPALVPRSPWPKPRANGAIDTKTANSPMIGFVLTKSGLMFNLSLNATKVSRLDI
jgi:hypothetical protein